MDLPFFYKALPVRFFWNRQRVHETSVFHTGNYHTNKKGHARGHGLFILGLWIITSDYNMGVFFTLDMKMENVGILKQAFHFSEVIIFNIRSAI